MRRFLIFVGIMFFLAPAVRGQANRAFIVAVSDYPAGSGWMKIHAANDAELLVPVLQKSGFDPRHITLLKNGQATFAAVTGELGALARRTGKGDYVYIHFSCHGQQMIDDNGDEEDGLDEALVPYDAPRRYESGVYEGERHLRDDMLEVLLDNIRKAAGPEGKVTVLFDACHSGTAHRDPDDGYVRGTAYVFGAGRMAAPAADPSSWKLKMSEAPDLSPMTVFSACMPDELNYEYREEATGTYYGSLTYAFLKVLDKKTDFTNVGFYRELANEMAAMAAKRKRKQTPYFESTDDRARFSISR